MRSAHYCSGVLAHQIRDVAGDGLAAIVSRGGQHAHVRIDGALANDVAVLVHDIDPLHGAVDMQFRHRGFDRVR